MVAPKNPAKDKAAALAASGPNDATARLQSADETAKIADAMDAELNELKARHDQYFLGLERVEPIKDRENFKKRLNALRTSHIRNTGLKFRVQSMWQKYISLERMWHRIAREIEEGTYSRDLFKARLRSAKREKKKDAPAKAKGEPTELDPEELAAGGSLEDALEAAAKSREPKTDPHLNVAPPAGEPELIRPASAEPALVRPAPIDPAAPRASGSFARPPPPPPEAGKPVTSSGARPPPPPQAAKPVSTASGARPPPPPEAAKPATTSGARPPPPPGAARTSSPGVRPPPPPGSSSGALPDDKMRAIYNAYVAAKRQCKEATDGITYESVAKTINSQAPELMKQHNAKAVDFKVVIKNGKATLKAVPRT